MKLLRPKYYVKSIYDINFNKLYDCGIRGIIFDIDNTLAKHGKEGSKRIYKLLNDLIKKGFKIGLLSNNDNNRINIFNSKIKLPYIGKAAKPLPTSYKAILKVIGSNVKNSIFVGDQLFTDILGANLVGISSFMVSPISKEEPRNIKFKRKLEKIFIGGIINAKKNKRFTRKN